MYYIPINPILPIQIFFPNRDLFTFIRSIGSAILFLLQSGQRRRYLRNEKYGAPPTSYWLILACFSLH